MQSSIFGKADLHVHTYHSTDALSSIRAVLKRAKKQQMDIVAITDHNTIKGAQKAQKIAPEFGIQIVVGEEITTKEGDLIALFIEEKIKSGRLVLETIKEIHRQGGLAIVPHPNNWFLGGISTKVLLKIFDKLDGIELFNGSWTGGIKRKESTKLNELLFDLAPLGGSDAHLARQVGCAYTVFPGKTPDDLYLAIKKKLTLPTGAYWSYKDRLFWLLNFPRIFYRVPQMPFTAFYRVLRKILT